MCSVIKQYWPVMTTSDETILFHDKKLSLLLMELNIKETKVEHSIGDCLLVRGCCFVIVPVWIMVVIRNWLIPTCSTWGGWDCCLDRYKTQKESTTYVHQPSSIDPQRMDTEEHAWLLLLLSILYIGSILWPRWRRNNSDTQKTRECRHLSHILTTHRGP